MPAERILDGGELERARRSEREACALLDLGLEPCDPPVLDRVFEAGVLAVCAVAEIALREEDRLRDRVDPVGRNEPDQIGEPGEGLGVSVTHPEAAADRDIVAGELAILLDRYEPEVLRKNINVVRWREREPDLKFSWEVGRAIHRLGFPAGDEFLVEEDFVVGPAFWQRKPAPCEGVGIDAGEERVALGVRGRHHIAVHIAAGRDRIEQNLMHPLDERLDIPLEHPVELECLPGGESERGCGHLVGKPVEDEPLAGGRAAAREPDAQHECERLFPALFLQRVAQIPVVLHIHPVEFPELVASLRDPAGRRVGEVARDVAAKKKRTRLERFVCAERFVVG